MVRRLPPSWPCGHYRRDEITGKLRGGYAAINSAAGVSGAASPGEEGPGGVGGGVTRVPRPLIAGARPLVGVSGGRAERHQRPGVLQEAADIPAAELAGEGGVLLVGEERRPFLPEPLGGGGARG